MARTRAIVRDCIGTNPFSYHFERSEKSLSRRRRHLMPEQQYCCVFNVKASVWSWLWRYLPAVKMIRLVFIHPLRYIAGRQNTAGRNQKYSSIQSYRENILWSGFISRRWSAGRPPGAPGPASIFRHPSSACLSSISWDRIGSGKTGTTINTKGCKCIRMKVRVLLYYSWFSGFRTKIHASSV